MITLLTGVLAERGCYRTREPGFSPYLDARLTAGLTQLALSERAGVTVQTIKRLDRGRPDVCRATRLAVRFALGMPWIEAGEQ